MVSNIEFLLGRKEVILNVTNTRSQIYNRRILITGAAGSIGSELVRLVLKYEPKSLCLLDHCEHGIYQLKLEFSGNAGIEFVLGDISDEILMLRTFKNAAPEIIFHTAAYKHVALLENSPYQAIKNNILGTQVIADLSVKYKAEKFIFISTDKAVKPLSIMGMTKRISEIYLQSYRKYKSSTKFVTTRFGNVFGSTGSVYHTFNYQIDNNLPITVSDRNASRYFMTLTEASQFVLEAAAIGRGGEVLVFDMGKPILIYDIAKRMVQQSQPLDNKKVEIHFTCLGNGEKQHEDLWHEEETLVATVNSLIKIAQSFKFSPINFKAQIAHLKKSLPTKNADELRCMLFSILNQEEVHRPVKQNIAMTLLRNSPIQMNIPTVHMD